MNNKKTSEALFQPDLPISSILDAAGDGIVIFNEYTNIIYWNKAAEVIFGYSSEEVLGKPLHYILQPQDEEFEQGWLADLGLTGAEQVNRKLLELKGIDKDGKEFPVEISLSRGETSGTKFFCAIIRDISERKQADYAWKESEERFKVTFDQAAVGITHIGPDGRWLRVNQRLCDIVGYTQEELNKLTFQDITYPPDLDKDLKYFGQMLAGEIENYSMEKRYIRKDGTTRWINLTVSMVRKPSGEPKYFISVVEDIQERKQAEEAQERSEKLYQTLVNNFPNGAVILFDRELRFTVVEGKGLAELGLNNQNYEGKTLWESFPAQTAAKLEPYYRAALNGEPVNFEFPSNGRIYEVDMLPVRRKEGREIFAAMIVAVDITKYKQAEDEIRKALVEAKELSELKSRFITMASHEFRTPLTSILSSSELLQHYNNRWTEDKRLEILQRIQTSVQYMTEILNNVLLFGQAEIGAVEFNPARLNLTNLCQQVVEELKFIDQNKHSLIFLNQTQDVIGIFDGKLLDQILRNLLSNSIKYSAAGSLISLELVGRPKEVMLEIIDRGIGIPQMDHKRLFEPFYRATNVGTVSGTGLGLAIVKRAVELHNGTITFTSEEGIGTTFRIVLPL